MDSPLQKVSMNETNLRFPNSFYIQRLFDRLSSIPVLFDDHTQISQLAGVYSVPQRHVLAPGNQTQSLLGKCDWLATVYWTLFDWVLLVCYVLSIKTATTNIGNRDKCIECIYLHPRRLHKHSSNVRPMMSP